MKSQPSQKMKRSLYISKKQKERIRKRAIQTPLIAHDAFKMILADKAHSLKVASLISKFRDIPKAEVLEIMRQHHEFLRSAMAEAATLLANKSIECIQQINPALVSQNSLALTAAILMDKSLKIQEAREDLPEPSPQQKLLIFVKENNIKFQDLLDIIRSPNKSHPAIPPNLWKQLESILDAVPNPQTLDIP